MKSHGSNASGTPGSEIRSHKDEKKDKEESEDNDEPLIRRSINNQRNSASNQEQINDFMNSNWRDYDYQ